MLYIKSKSTLAKQYSADEVSWCLLDSTVSIFTPLCCNWEINLATSRYDSPRQSSALTIGRMLILLLWDWTQSRWAGGSVSCRVTTATTAVCWPPAFTLNYYQLTNPAAAMLKRLMSINFSRNVAGDQLLNPNLAQNKYEYMLIQRLIATLNNLTPNSTQLVKGHHSKGVFQEILGE